MLSICLAIICTTLKENVIQFSFPIAIKLYFMFQLQNIKCLLCNDFFKCTAIDQMINLSTAFGIDKAPSSILYYTLWLRLLTVLCSSILFQWLGSHFLCQQFTKPASSHHRPVHTAYRLLDNPVPLKLCLCQTKIILFFRTDPSLPLPTSVYKQQPNLHLSTISSFPLVFNTN